MAYFRKLPVVIEAVQFKHNDEGNRPQFHDEGAYPAWLRLALERRDIVPRPEGLLIKTKEGPLTASPGDWIIKGTAGELYPCKPEIFSTIYELARDTGD